MRQLAKRHSEGNHYPVALNDDGELQDFVFCLHCHTVNPCEAVQCASCKRPLVEPPSDLRDRLDRIREHNSHQLHGSATDLLFQRSEDFSDGILQSIQRTLTTIVHGILNALVYPLILARKPVGFAVNILEKLLDYLGHTVNKMIDSINSATDLDDLIFERQLLTVLIIPAILALVFLVLVGFLLMQVK